MADFLTGVLTSIVATCKLNDVNLTDTLIVNIDGDPNSRIGDLMP